MKVSVIKATDKRTNTILFAEGIEDSSTSVQVIVPRSIFTFEEIADIKADKYLFSGSNWNVNPSSDYFNMGDSDAYHFLCDLTNLKIEIVEVSVENIDFLEKYDYNDNDLVSVLTVRNNETKEIIFAEGTDIDGYGNHYLTIDDTLVEESSNDDSFSLKDFVGKEVEARHVVGDYKYVTISKEQFKVA